MVCSYVNISRNRSDVFANVGTWPDSTTSKGQNKLLIILVGDKGSPFHWESVVKMKESFHYLYTASVTKRRDLIAICLSYDCNHYTLTFFFFKAMQLLWLPHLYLGKFSSFSRIVRFDRHLSIHASSQVIPAWTFEPENTHNKLQRGNYDHGESKQKQQQ